MKKLMAIIAIALYGLFTAIAWADTNITGAGATFPYPIYSKWTDAYQKVTGAKINYQPIGSGGGIKQIQAKLVDFGASDKPLASAELSQSDLIQFPTLIGGVVAIINLPGITSDQVKLSGPVLADIYLGNIKNWNDPKVKALNPSVTLPNQAITVVHRSDGSGTTFLFTNYLSKVSTEWKKNVGDDTAVSWPAGIGGKGNEGVASYVQRVKGSIGYVEFAYAQHNKFAVVQLINKDGKAVSPTTQSFQASAANAAWSEKNDFSEILTNQSGDNSWPITGATFILMHKHQDNAQQALAVLQFFDWAYKNGGQMAADLDYVALPKDVVGMIRQYWSKTIKDLSGKSIWQ